MDVEVPASSGDPETDSLVERRWVTAGAPLTFGFPTLATQFTGYTNGEPSSSFEALNATQQAAVRTVLGSIASFTNLVFSELTGADAANAVLRFGMTDASATAHAYLPAATEQGGDSWYRNTGGTYDNPVLGNYAWDTFLHEIGHALGLIHPHESTPPMPGEHDWMAYTVMSYRSTASATDELGYYNEQWGFPQSYMIEDIAALQFLYGANYAFNAGNTVYRWDSTTGQMSIDGAGQATPGGNRVFTTIWDGGGNDTYDFSNSTASTAGRIDLRPGAWSFISNDQLVTMGGGHRPPGNVANAALVNDDPRSLIENVIGTRYEDTIYGNDAANILDGGGGDDYIYGLGGADILYGARLYGGEGNDTLFGDLLNGDAGNDALYGGAASNQIYGGDGDDWLEGRDGNDGLLGGGGRDSLIGGLGDDGMSGGDGNDILAGDEGDDGLGGDAGNDVLTGGNGNDNLDGDAGADVMTGGLGNDTYSIDEIGDQIVEVVGEGTDTVQATISYIAPLAIENIVLMDISTIGYTGPPRLTGPINATGNSLVNLLTGNSEANVLDGREGADEMRGWNGDDTFIVDDANDRVYEFQGGGNDTVYSSVSYTLASTPAEWLDPNYDPYAGASLRDPVTMTYAVETLILTGTANLNGTGSEIANTIEGNSGNNLLNGKEGNDTLVGGGGADELVGGAGADTFLYRAPSDSTALQMDWLSDFAHGVDRIDVRPIATTGFTFDVFESGAPSAWTRVTIATSAAAMAIKVAGIASLADFLYTLPVVPGLTLTGTPGSDTLQGGAGNDRLDGAGGIDTLIGLGGDDWYFVDNALDSVTEGAGGGASDRVSASVSYALGAGVQVEMLTTSDNLASTAINLTGNELANIIFGNAGANVLDGRGGIDALIGFGGDDWYFVDNAADTVNEGAGGGSLDRISASVSYTLGAGVQVEMLTTADNLATTAINLTGNELANIVFGNAGANVLDGRGGADSLIGFAGNDWYFVDNAADTVNEGAGGGTLDRVFASVSYTLGAGVQVEIMSTADNLATAAINLTGNELGQYIFGNAGANVLDGAGGADSLIGFGGDDWYYVDNAADSVNEGAGGGTLDRISASLSYALGAGVQVEMLTTSDNLATTAINLSGNEFDQYVFGNAGANLLDGRAGADIMVGLGGDDWYFVDNALDSVSEGAGGGTLDRISASVGYTLGAGVQVEMLTTADNLATTAIDLAGNELDQYLFGNAGANVLDGKGGADVLIGLGGADAFRFSTALGGGNVDAIGDYNVADDTIQLDDAVFTGLAAGALAAGAFRTGAAAADADDRIVYNNASGALYFDADGNGAGAAVHFATVVAGLALTEADFLVI